jgi:hypothetical protein
MMLGEFFLLIICDDNDIAQLFTVYTHPGRDIWDPPDNGTSSQEREPRT